MLLRRVIEHVKAQNWTAVMLDLVIVVVGVFIGIQVSNWNGARAERAQETDILLALREDIQESSDHLAERLGDIDGQLAALRKLAEIGETRELDADMRRDIDRLILIGLFEQVFVRPRLVVLDELRGSGRLRLIRSDALRYRLQQLDTDVMDLNLLTSDLSGFTHLHTDSFLLANVPTRNYVNESSFPLGSPEVDWMENAPELPLDEDLLTSDKFESLVLYKGRIVGAYRKAVERLLETYRALGKLADSRLRELGALERPYADR